MSILNHPQVRDMSGFVFGRLTVLKFGGLLGRLALWECVCQCGRTAVVRGSSLRNHDTQSCGCIHREEVFSRSRTHGASKTPEYKTWTALIGRCKNPNDHRFDFYGGRGITVCDRWSAFENFLADMGPRPSLKHSIDRRNNELGYSPDNCRWATKREQMNNKRSNRQLTIGGQTQTVSEWALSVGIPATRVFARLKLGWSAEQAINPDTRPKPYHYKNPDQR